MNILALFNHLLNFVAPAVFVGFFLAALAPWVLRKSPRRGTWMVRALSNTVCGLGALVAGLWFFGNAGKMASAQGYWQSLFSFSGLGSYAMSPLLNAGFLAPWVLAALWWGLRAPWRRGSVVGALVLWMLVWWCVFLLPSQRSARYLIPTLPALAICLALVLPPWSVPSPKAAHGSFDMVSTTAALSAAVLASKGIFP